MSATLPPTGERLLADQLRRAQRAGNQQLLVLHLADLPSVRPHHRRIARSLLQDAASRHGGQVFPMRNGDLALLTAITEGSGSAIDPAHLPATFAELFHADRHSLTTLLSVWQLDRDQTPILQYLQSRLNQPPTPPAEEEPPPPAHIVEDITSLLTTAPIGDLTQRQTAIEILPDLFSPDRAAKLMRPLFREITFSLEVLERRLSVTGRATSDPYLFRHLAARLDPRMMELVLAGLPGAETDAPRLHLNLTLQTLLSPAFDHFAAQCAARNLKPGIEVALIEASRAPDQFAAARAKLTAQDFPLIIEGVTPLALRLANPAGFGADFVKLDWDQALATRIHPDLPAAIKRLGANRIILQRASSEQALAFGLSHGITRFQGQHVDAMLAAARLKACPHASLCNLRQCSERAAAVGEATRRFCLNTPLLDRSLPP